MELNDFLVWLMAGGSVIAWSWVMEQVAWFQNLSSGQRKWTQYGGSTLIGLAALAVTTYVPVATLDAIAPWFAIIAGIFGMVFINQAAHKINPNR